MKRKLIYVFVVFIMFLSPFLILSNHFSNTVDMLSVDNIISVIENSANMLSSRISSLLIDEYDIAKEIRGEKNIQNIISKLKEISKNKVVKRIAYCGMDRKVYYSNSNDNKICSDSIFDSAKKLDIPVGRALYPDNCPPELIVGEKLGKGVLISVTDLGYLNEVLSKLSKKNIDKLYLIDSSFNIIFDSEYNYVLNNSNIADLEIIKLINDLKSKNLYNYSGIIDIKGKKNIIAISNIDSTNWWIYALRDYSRSFDLSLKKWVRRVVISGIILILVFSYITLILYEKFLYRK